MPAFTKPRRSGFSAMPLTWASSSSTIPYGTLTSYGRTATVISAACSSWNRCMARKSIRVRMSPFMTRIGVSASTSPSAPAVPSGRSSDDVLDLDPELAPVAEVAWRSCRPGSAS